MQVILSRLRSVKAIISSAEYFCCTGKVVLIKILWVLGMASSIFWRDPRSARGSPPVKTKSQRGVISSMVWMLRRMASRLKPEQSAYSFLLMQKGQ